jgi:hypothetical protein
VWEGVPVQKAMSPFHSKHTLSLRNNSYNNSKNPTVNSQVNIRGVIGVQAKIQVLKVKEYIKLVTVGCQVACPGVINRGHFKCWECGLHVRSSQTSTFMVRGY